MMMMMMMTRKRRLGEIALVAAESESTDLFPVCFRMLEACLKCSIGVRI
jgi:hypothetical protein